MQVSGYSSLTQYLLIKVNYGTESFSEFTTVSKLNWLKQIWLTYTNTRNFLEELHLTKIGQPHVQAHGQMLQTCARKCDNVCLLNQVDCRIYIFRTERLQSPINLNNQANIFFQFAYSPKYGIWNSIFATVNNLIVCGMTCVRGCHFVDFAFVSSVLNKRCFVALFLLNQERSKRFSSNRK